jgi:hypothetical protein
MRSGSKSKNFYCTLVFLFDETATEAERFSPVAGSLLGIDASSPGGGTIRGAEKMPL